MPNQLHRRTLLQASLATGAALAVPPAFAADNGPIRLGCLTSLSGSQAVLGRPVLEGANIAVEQINAAGGVLGRKLELVVRDDQANATVAVAAVRELVGNGVTLVFGGLVTPVVLAIAGVLPGLGAVYFSSGAYGTALTHEAYSRNYFRIGDNAYMRSRAVARMMAEDYPTSPNWGGIVVDSETGHSAFSSFVSGMKEFFHTATLNPPVLTSFGATDYKSQIYALLNQNLDGLFIAVYGNDEVTFLQQASGLGLTQKLKVAVDLGAGDEVLNALRGRVPAEYWTGTHWYYGLYPDVAMSTKLVADYGARKSGEKPDGFVGEGHASVYAIAAGLRKAGSTATEAFITAMEGLTIDTDKGQRTVRKEDHQAVCDLNFMRISRSDAPHGWSVTKGRKIDGGLVIEPPSPGKALVL